MNPTHAPKAPAFDTASISATIERALASAGLKTDSGPMQGVTDTIRRALSSAGMHQAPASGDAPSVIDVVAREIGDRTSEPALPAHVPSAEPAAPGQFVTRRFRNAAGERAYKLYVPAADPGVPMPLVVMLHGCKQSPDDFAAGTQMNRLAETHGFIVVYPEQAANANGSNCWNWFRAQDQARDGGEPSLIAGITREVAANHPVDPSRIYVAGLSAGAAMAVILGETYPELYAGVGAHSGLPYAAAHDVASAFAAMAGGRGGMPDLSNLPDLANLPGLANLPDLANLPGLSNRSGLLNATGLSNLPGASPAPGRKAARFVPTIVFHGDQDQTVRLGNGAEIVQQATSALGAEQGGQPLTSSTQSGVGSGGRGYSHTVYSDLQGRGRIESWVLHGAGHAWSGGDARGSYTDRTGPDASAEMVRFFLAQPLAGSA